ncbi:hypothetical protein SCUP234_09858 [Seiridium cupressi]
MDDANCLRLGASPQRNPHEEPLLPDHGFEEIQSKAQRTLLDPSHVDSHEFPVKWNLYSNKTSSIEELFIGEHRAQPIYAVKRTDKNRWKLRNMCLYAGPSTSDPFMASGSYIDDDYKKWEITLYDTMPQVTTLTTFVTERYDWKRNVFQFSIPTDIKNQEEIFEWRATNNPRLKTVLNGQSFGWKLVRMTQDDFLDIKSGPVRGLWPSTSDNKEVVAVCAKNGTVWTKYWRFAFLGTGTTGMLGTRWRRMAVITALMLMDCQFKRDMDSA